MRLLLVLSAFLTALVGLGAVPAAARPASEVCASAITKSERQVARIVVIARSETGVSDRADIGLPMIAPAPVNSVPLYAERFRV